MDHIRSSIDDYFQKYRKILSNEGGYTLSDICMRNDFHVLCVQETHKDLTFNRPKIKKMKLVKELLHAQHGSAIYDLTYKDTVSSNNGGTDTLSMEFDHIAVISLYNPPNQPYCFVPQLNHSKANVVMGDFNSHHTLCGYKDTDEDGHAV